MSSPCFSATSATPGIPADIPETIEYYLARTSNGSTLSALVHASVLARANRDQRR